MLSCLSVKNAESSQSVADFEVTALQLHVPSTIQRYSEWMKGVHGRHDLFSIAVQVSYKLQDTQVMS